MPGANYPGQSYFGQDYPLLAAGGASNNADLAVTEANDTLSSTVAVAIAAALSVTEANDTLVAADTEVVTATLAVTDANDTIVSAGSAAIAASLTDTEANDTLTADGTGSGINASLTVTEADDSLTHASSPMGMLLALTQEAPDGTVADAGGARTADLNVTEDNDTLSAGGTVPGTVQDYSGWKPWRLIHGKKKKKTRDEELAELAAFLRTVAEAKPKIIEIVRPPIEYHGPLAVVFYDPKTTDTVNAIMAKAKADAKRREDDDEEALLLLLD